ncbi:hypothetical protein [Paraburkholderia translucens]|uniref:hypothetical protein n=1 Tax=Paraburkholderia translucens TaxID=2886945 RepID=UPI002E795121|nr:hypothetical protein [Paraburkholderia sp. MMS20-SJTN17]
MRPDQSEINVMPASHESRDPSPYTFHNIDPAIAHLEQALGAQGAESLFSRTYWRRRVLQALATTGLLPSQQQRLQKLLDAIDASHSNRAAISSSPPSDERHRSEAHQLQLRKEDPPESPS